MAKSTSKRPAWERVAQALGACAKELGAALTELESPWLGTQYAELQSAEVKAREAQACAARFHRPAEQTPPPPALCLSDALCAEGAE